MFEHNHTISIEIGLSLLPYNKNLRLFRKKILTLIIKKLFLKKYFFIPKHHGR